MCVLVAQSCPTLGNPVDYSQACSSVYGDSPGKNTGEACHALLQGIFPTQGLNPGLWHCKWILYQLSHQGSPRGVMDAVISRMRRETSDMFGESQGRLPGESNLLAGTSRKTGGEPKKGR